MTYSFSAEPGRESVANKEFSKKLDIWDNSSFFTLNDIGERIRENSIRIEDTA